jgi:hypothetical protein
MGKIFPTKNCVLNINKTPTELKKIQFNFAEPFSIQFPECTMSKIDKTTVVMNLSKIFLKRLAKFNQNNFNEINKIWKETFNEQEFDINVIFDPSHDLQTFTIENLPENLPHCGVLLLLGKSIILEQNSIYLNWEFINVIDLDTTDNENEEDWEDEKK